MKSYDEILQLYLEPVLKKLQGLQQLIEQEEDFDSNHDKQSLYKMLGEWLENFEESRDGAFETHDPDLVEVDTDAAIDTTDEDASDWNVKFEQAEDNDELEEFDDE